MQCLELNLGYVMTRLRGNRTGRSQDVDSGLLLQGLGMPQDSEGAGRTEPLTISPNELPPVFRSSSVQPIGRKFGSLEVRGGGCPSASDTNPVGFLWSIEWGSPLSKRRRLICQVRATR